MSLHGAIGALDSNLSFSSLSSRAATALSLHLTILVDSTGNTFTTAHVNGKVSFTLTELSVNFNANSASIVSGNSATANSLWLLTFLYATVFTGIDELFWTLFGERLSSAKAFSVNVSLALLASALYTLIFGSLPRVTNFSLVVITIGTA